MLFCSKIYFYFGWRSELLEPARHRPMKNLRMLTVTFSEEIRPEELEHFRGALVEKVGIQFERYHNHNNSGNGSPAFHYRYPLIQYQLFRGRPRLVFLEDAIEDARHFFTQPDWDLHMHEREYRTSIAELKATQHQVGVTPGQFHHYRLRRWQALNTDNFQEFQSLETLVEMVGFLERVLSGQALSFFTGLDYRLPEHFQLQITNWDSTYCTTYKNVKVSIFNIAFRTELLLPPGIGLGKGVSLGFGRVDQPRAMQRTTYTNQDAMQMK